MVTRGFAFEVDPSDDLSMVLLASPLGSRADPIAVWTRTFDTIDDRNAALDGSYKGDFDLGFYGRLTMLTGNDERPWPCGWCP